MTMSRKPDSTRFLSSSHPMPPAPTTKTLLVSTAVWRSALPVSLNGFTFASTIASLLHTFSQVTATNDGVITTKTEFSAFANSISQEKSSDQLLAYVKLHAVLAHERSVFRRKRAIWITTTVKRKAKKTKSEDQAMTLTKFLNISSCSYSKDDVSHGIRPNVNFLFNFMWQLRRRSF